LDILDIPAFDWTMVESHGCALCNETWYQWRTAILEVLEITEDMRNLIIDRENESWILTKARENWFITLLEDWIIKVLKWETTLDEIHRVI
jgi:type II secretory ATPase GspE/PulE/Tfp pilus assembly ATPase PilB-like protein